MKLPFILSSLLVCGIALVSGCSSSKQVEVPVVKENVQEAVFGIGTVTARSTYQLKLAVAASVLEVFAPEGKRVSSGMPLVSLQGLGVFRAPFSGTVTNVAYKAGETVGAQSSVLTLTDLKDVYVTVQLEQQGAARVRAGQLAQLSFDALRDKTLTGKVASVYSHAGQFLVQIEVSGLPPEILPGMTADVGIVVNQKADAITVPAWAVPKGKTLAVKRASGQKAEIPFEFGISSGERVELLGTDLAVGDKILVSQPKAQTAQ